MPKAYRIAILDHDDLMRELTLQWLDDAGHRASPESIQSLQGGTVFDLIILDLASPRADGVLMRRLRTLHAGPVLLLSARLRRGQSASAHLARQLGVNVVLPKPFSRAELMQAIDEVMA